MIKGINNVGNISYKSEKADSKKMSFSQNKDEFVLSTQKKARPESTMLSKLKSIFAAMAIGLSTQSCSDDSPVDDIDTPQSGQVLDFGDALDKLRDDAYNLTTQEIIEKLDSTVYANRDKIDDFAGKSDENYQTTSNFVNTVLSAFGTENSEHSTLDDEFKTLADKNDGLLNQDYVNRINELYENINNIMVENPGFFDSNGYLTDISNKQGDLKTNCKVANTVRENALKKLRNDAIDFNEEEPVIDSDEYNTVYNKYMTQVEELLERESLNTKEAEEAISEFINTYNELNSIAESNGKRSIYEAGLKMLNASHTMVDAACRALIDAMEEATSNVTPNFSDSFKLIHYNLDKIMNTNDYDSPVVDEIIEGLNL